MNYNCKQVENRCRLYEANKMRAALLALEKLKDTCEKALRSDVTPKTCASMSPFRRTAMLPNVRNDEIGLTCDLPTNLLYNV